MCASHCSMLFSKSHLAIIVSLASRVSIIMADSIVLGVTWMRAAGTVREARRLRLQVTLSEVLLRDGERLPYLSILCNGLKSIG